MRAVAHGWKPDRIKGPSRAVAREFVNADRKYSGGFAENRYNTGGLAAMSEINSGVPVTLSFQGGGAVLPLTGNAAMQAALEPVEGAERFNVDMSAFAGDDLSTMERAYRQAMMAGLEGQGYYAGEDNIWYAPTTTVTGGEPAPPRIIPGAVGAPPPAGSPFGSDPRPPNMVGALPALTRAEQTTARRETPYREQLRAHKERVAAALNPAPQVEGAKGGYMNYQAGGAVPAPVERPTPITGGGAAIPGHPEGTNPNRPGTALYSRWEKRYHYDPPPPPTDPMPAPDEGGGITGWLLEKLGLSPDFKEGTADDLTAIGEARGGRVRRYQVGGLAQAAPGPGQFRPPAGGVPPTHRGLPPRAGGIPPRMEPPRAGGTVLGQPLPGAPAPGGGGVPGGPRVPPNQRGFLQRQRMMNRPPANVGGGVNRVGQQDQQGGLARALQRGTGRPPMSRRSGFPGTR